MLDRSDSSAGTEPRPSLGIAHLTILRGGGISLLCHSDGDFDAAQDGGAGLYLGDGRYLSALRTTIGGAPLTPLGSNDRGFWLATTLTNPDFPDRDGKVIAAQSVVVRRLQVVGDGLAMALTVTNHARHELAADLAIRFDADFEDIFVIRGVERRAPKPEVRVTVGNESVAFLYRGGDAIERSTVMAFSETPSSLSENIAKWRLRLAPGGSFQLLVTASLDGRKPPTAPSETVQRETQERTDWLSEVASFDSSHSGLNALYERSLNDLYSLGSDRGRFHFLAAGVPWFDALFGRDSLITGIALLRTDSRVLRDALVCLADEQASDTDAARDAAPGKIPHELRTGELANTGEVLFGRYYGSVDATPLFVIGLREYLRWSGDRETVELLMPAALRAIDWCLSEVARDPLGMLSYRREGAGGLEHQGWKDSWDGIPGEGVEPVTGPVALVEVQAYLAAALSAFGELVEQLGNERPEALTALGAVLKQMRDRFVSLEDCPLAYDGSGRAIRAKTSNPGHAIWAGVCTSDEATKLAASLMLDHLFTGWGIRTLSSEALTYNPLGYHVGSVWPHDNAIILDGFRRYGLVEHVQRLGTALLEAMLGFSDGRIPELFSGDRREDSAFPTAYPTASRPQAWSSASLPWAIGSLLGITASSPATLFVVRPTLPPWLDWARITNLRFGATSVDLFFRREGTHIGIEVEGHRGPGEVVLSPRWPIRPLRPN